MKNLVIKKFKNVLRLIYKEPDFLKKKISVK